MGTAGEDAASVRALIALGHSRGVKKVAEGVATPAQLYFLRAEQCDPIQELLMSPAVAAGDFAALPRTPKDLAVRGVVEPIRLTG